MTADQSWDIAVTMLSVYDANGFLGIQCDSEGSEGGGLSSGADATPIPPGGGVRDYEAIAPGGLYHRPSDPAVDANGNPNSAQAALVLNLREGGRVYSMGLGDPRVVALLPEIGKGDTLLAGDNGSFVRIVGSGPNVGRISLYTTTDGTPGGMSVYETVWPDRFERVAPWMQERGDATGYSLVVGACRFDMMTMAGGLGPAAAFGASASLTTSGSIALDAPLVQLGAVGATGHGPVVRGDLLQAQVIAPLASAVETLQVQLEAVATVLAALAAALAANPASYPLFAAAAAPSLTAGVTAIGLAAAAVTTIASALESPVLLPTNAWASPTTSVS